jgi:hypothetical protein
VNVVTKPPQASVSARITGPGFSATVDKAPLHADGKGQIRGVITTPGTYTATITVYNALGNATATVTKTIPVTEEDGPITVPRCDPPAE